MRARVGRVLERGNDREENGAVLGLISVGEYIEYFQPDVAATLWAWAGTAPGPGLRAVVSLSFREWDRIMREPPKPGRAGILEGEEIG